ncbi:MAG: peptide/nickel transport system permease protein, partial [Thermotogota bacterium]|nr:peptide/nickel transport system permease protein [Thermotogota bacterium]
RSVFEVLKEAIPYDLALLLPSILVSWIAGNLFGAVAARRKKLDSFVLPVLYILTATPYLWLGILLAWTFGVLLDIFPIAGAYSFSMRPSLSLAFIWDFLKHWILPFLSLFIVMLGGWAIGMRNMIIYELEANYARYLETLGAPQRLIRKYAFRNAVLPQVTGLALQLGVIVAGALTTEIVFSYPGIGYILMQGILNQDYFLIQGCFLFIIIGVLLANFFVDLIYVFIDPRVRYAFGGETA